MVHIGRAGHPGPDRKDTTPGFLSVEFVCAQFLAVAEHW